MHGSPYSDLKTEVFPVAYLPVFYQMHVSFILQGGNCKPYGLGWWQQEAWWVGRTVQDRPWGETPQGGGLQLRRSQGKHSQVARR